MTCPNCQAPITLDMPFCPRCGVELRAVGAARWVDSSPRLPDAAARGADGSGDAGMSPAWADAWADGAGALYLVPPPLLARLFGPHETAASDDEAAASAGTPGPAAAPPAHRLLHRVVPHRFATNLWVMAALGALVALGLGLALSIPLSHVVDANSFSSLLNTGGGWLTTTVGETAAQLIYLIAGDPIRFFLVANRLPLEMTVTTANGQAGPSAALYAITLPLFGTLLVPAVALTLGGYLSASSRAARVPRYAIARGALIGPFYGVALYALTVVVEWRPSVTDLGNGIPASIVAPPGWALLLGTLWGVVFGALGGWIAVSGRAWLAAALATWRASHAGHAPRLAGALAGAFAATLWSLVAASALALGVAGTLAI